MPAIVLGFDTSKTGAGALMEKRDGRARLLMLREVHFGTLQGDNALKELFAAAKEFGAVVCAEKAMGDDPRGFSIRSSTSECIGVLKAMTREYDLTWGGVIVPGTAKLALTGYGRATKERMVYFANALYSLSLTLPKGEHQADACGIALAGIDGRFAGMGKRVTKKTVVKKERVR